MISIDFLQEKSKNQPDVGGKIGFFEKKLRYLVWYRRRYQPLSRS